MDSYLSTYLGQSAQAAAALAADGQSIAMLQQMAGLIENALRGGGKLLLAGNGGSAADAQHIAAEFVSRLMFDRAPMAAIALSESGPILSACGNDYGFETIFARQVDALARPGDVLLALSTSGNSANLLAAADAARRIGAATLGFAGQDGGAMPARFDRVFRPPAAAAQIVQQLHMVAAHALLATVERAMFAGLAPAA